MTEPTGVCVICKQPARLRCSACRTAPVFYCGKKHQNEDWRKHKAVCRAYEMSDITGICAVCKKPAKSRCSSCQTVFYCGMEHQKDDWRKHKAVCRAYEVKSSPEFGRHVVAKRNMKEGEIIVKETPLVVGPDYKMESSDICLGCYQQGEIRSRCPQCNWPVCNSNCPGIGDPTRHGSECSVLGQIPLVMFCQTFILPLRCLLLQKSDPQKWKILKEMALQTEAVNRTHLSRESKIVFEESVLKLLAKKAPKLLPECSSETVNRVYAVLDMFGLNIRIPGFGPLTAVCSVASLMEHSCLANTRRFVDIPRGVVGEPWGLRLIVRASGSISKGENISTLFVDTFMCSYARQDNLRSRRNVHCKCARCSDPTELGTNFGTLRCRNLSCTGWVLPINTPEVDKSDWKCKRCGVDYSPEDIKLQLCEIQRMMEPLRAHEKQDVHKYEAMLIRLQKFLHPNHHYCLLLKSALCEYFDRLSDSTGGMPAPETLMSDYQLEKTAEFGRDLVSVLRNSAIVTQNTMFCECLRQLSSTNVEIAKRKLLSGAWSLDRAKKVIKESREMLNFAVQLRQSVFDKPSTEKHRLPEVLNRLCLSSGSKQAGK